jgi:hypothetical protein
MKNKLQSTARCEGEGVKGRRAERLPRWRLRDRGAFEKVLAIGLSMWHMGDDVNTFGSPNSRERERVPERALKRGMAWERRHSRGRQHSKW